MAEPSSLRDSDRARPSLPTLAKHLDRIQSHLRGCGLLAFAPAASPIRDGLARFMEEHGDGTARIWADTVGAAFRIGNDDLARLAKDMRQAQARWLAHVRDPEDLTTHAALGEQAREGFIAEHPPSRFVTSQLKIRQILPDLLRRERAESPDLPEMLALLDEAVRECILHVTDFFVEARLSERRRLELQLVQSEKMSTSMACFAGR